MYWKRLAASFLALLALCPLAVAQSYNPRIKQYCPLYEPNDPNVPSSYYQIGGQSPHFTIEILLPSIPGSPYEFDSYNLDDPNQAAHIKRIFAVPDVGDVELVIKGHNGRLYGATNIYGLALDPADGIHATLKEFTISGLLGYDEDTYVETIEGPAHVAGIHKGLHAESITGDFDLSAIMAPVSVPTVSGDLTSNLVDNDSPITIGTLSGSFYTNNIDPNSPVNIETLSESGSFSVGDPSEPGHAIHSPVTIGTLAGSFRANMIEPDSDVLIDMFSGEFEVSNQFLSGGGWTFGVQSPVYIASMTGQDASLEIKELFSQLLTNP